MIIMGKTNILIKLAMSALLNQFQLIKIYSLIFNQLYLYRTHKWLHKGMVAKICYIINVTILPGFWLVHNSYDNRNTCLMDRYLVSYSHIITMSLGLIYLLYPQCLPCILVNNISVVFLVNYQYVCLVYYSSLIYHHQQPFPIVVVYITSYSVNFSKIS